MKVTLETQEPLKSVYCPSHNVEIKRDGDNKAVVGFEEKNVRPDTDFKLIFSRKKNDIGINLLTYRNGAGRRLFPAAGVAGMDVEDAKVQPKDICFVLDTSGSMAGKKMEQAKKAPVVLPGEPERRRPLRDHPLLHRGRAILRRAQAGATRRTSPRRRRSSTASSRSAAPRSTRRCRRRSSSARPRGRQGDKRPYVVIFLTDGQPTIGETTKTASWRNVDKANAGGVRASSPSASAPT